MPLEPQPNEIKTSIGNSRYIFLDADPEDAEQESLAKVYVNIKDQNGKIMREREGDMLVDVMTPEEKATMQDLIAVWRQRITGALIP